MNPRRRLLYLAVVTLVILDRLRRMLAGTRPIDWVMLVVELLVLFLIAYEAAENVLHKRKMRQNISALVPFVQRGQALQTSIAEETDCPPTSIQSARCRLLPGGHSDSGPRRGQ